MKLLTALTGAFHHAGVRMMAGTDAPIPGVVPGFSQHDELKLLVAAGLPPSEALRAATVNAATFLGKANEFGTVEVGKRADLVLLDDDPLQDVANTSRYAGVMVRGRWLDGDALRRALTD